MAAMYPERTILLLVDLGCSKIDDSPLRLKRGLYMTGRLKEANFKCGVGHVINRRCYNVFTISTNQTTLSSANAAKGTVCKVLAAVSPVMEIDHLVHIECAQGGHSHAMVQKDFFHWGRSLPVHLRIKAGQRYTLHDYLICIRRQPQHLGTIS